MKPFPFPADSIIASAAQSAIRIVETQTKEGLSNIPNLISVAHLAAVAQLVGIHTTGIGGMGDGSKQERLKERERAIRDVEKCMKCLEIAEDR